MLLALRTGIAGAAELPLKAPRAPPPAPFTWTGLYIGGNIGIAETQSHWTDSLFGLDWGRTTDARFMGGGQVGFNYQFAGPNFVLGAEAQFDWAANRGSVTAVGPLVGHGFQIASNDTSITTAAARIGLAGPWEDPPHAVYGKIGGGWVGNNGFTVTDLTTGQVFNGGTSRTVSGWMAGGGIEYAFSNSWSTKLEYDYIGLGGRTFTLPGLVIPALAGDTIISNHNVQLVKFGINYRLNWGGMVGNY